MLVPASSSSGLRYRIIIGIELMIATADVLMKMILLMEIKKMIKMMKIKRMMMIVKAAASVPALFNSSGLGGAKLLWV